MQPAEVTVCFTPANLFTSCEAVDVVVVAVVNTLI